MIDAVWSPSVLEEKPMQKARRRRRRFGPAAVGMWSSRAQTATHHPNENDESLKIDSSSLNARMVGEPISYQER